MTEALIAGGLSVLGLAAAALMVTGKSAKNVLPPSSTSYMPAAPALIGSRSEQSALGMPPRSPENIPILQGTDNIPDAPDAYTWTLQEIVGFDNNGRACPARLLHFQQHGENMSVAEVVQAWGDTDFAIVFCDALEAAGSGCQDIFMECTPVCKVCRDQEFACTVVDADATSFSLAYRTTGTSATGFAAHMAGADPIVAFPNLDRSALLVAPNAGILGSPDWCGSILPFLRDASDGLKAALWYSVASRIANATLHMSEDDQLWVNTDGRGVPWLHVRIDTEPKYYKAFFGGGHWASAL